MDEESPSKGLGPLSTLVDTPVAVVAPTLIDAARAIVRGPSLNRTKTAGYDVKAGERVLLVAKTTDDPAVTEVLAQAIRECGAQIDVFHVEIPDRPMEAVDELRGLLHNIPGVEPDPNFDRWRKKFEWIERVAEEQDYALLIQGEGGPIPRLKGPRYEGAPWYHRLTFPAAGFPWPLWDLINRKAWQPIWEKGRGASVHLTDPEGTDLHFTLRPEHWTAEHYASTNSRRRFQQEYYLAHLYGWPTPPYRPDPPAEGVVAGTINHYSRPFPHCLATVEGGKVTKVEGGGEYGERWREIMDLTKDIKYPEFPDKGLFWWWECAIGTHPRMVRPPFAFTLSGHAAMYERLRSGYVHIGFGTANGNPSEKWAQDQGLPWGHLHLHLQFANYVMTTVEGEEITVIANGHLTALDDPEVVELANKYGDPGSMLEEAWVPPLPGVSVSGDYWNDYAPDPAGWIERHDDEGQVLEGG